MSFEYKLEKRTPLLPKSKCQCNLFICFFVNYLLVRDLNELLFIVS